jgi:hypothetical protein
VALDVDLPMRVMPAHWRSCPPVGEQPRHLRFSATQGLDPADPQVLVAAPFASRRDHQPARWNGYCSTGSGQGNGSTKMLRITVHDYAGAVVLQLEGRVAVPWLPELEKCWQRAVAGRDKSALTIDVTAVTFIDAAGKACLTAMHREGATFVACDCLTKSIVEEITRSHAPDRGLSENDEGAGRENP